MKPMRTPNRNSHDANHFASWAVKTNLTWQKPAATNNLNLFLRGKSIISIIAFLLIVFASDIARSANIIITTNTNWSALTTGSGPGGQPNNTDQVRVRNGATLTVDVNNGACSLLAVGQGGSDNFTSTIVFNSGSEVTVSGNFVLGGVDNRFGSLDMTAGGILRVSLMVYVHNLGTFTAGTGTVEYNGTTQQSVSGDLAPFYNNLILSNSARKNAANADITVNGTLTMNCRFVLSTFNLTIGETGTIDITTPSETSMIVASGGGELRKVFSADGTFTFPVGDNMSAFNYSPVTLNVRGTAYSNAYVGVSVTDVKHPNNASPSNFLTRYWNVNQTGITDCLVDFTGTYIDSDFGGNEAAISSAQLNGVFDQTTNPWIKYNPVNTASNAVESLNSTITDGVVSAFTGIRGGSPTVTINGGDVSVCANVPVQLTAVATGDPVLTYSWDPATGLSSPTISNPIALPGITTVYTVTVTDGNGATATDSTTITIIPGTASGQPGGITGPILICDGQTSIQFSVQPVPNATTYVWTLPAGATIATGAGTRIITVDFPTPFTGGQICVATTNACGTLSANRCLTLNNVTTYTPPNVVGPQNICANATGLNYSVLNINGAISYDWVPAAGMTITSGQGTNNVTVDTDPTFAGGPLCVTVTNGCGTSLPRCRNTILVGGSTPGGITGTSFVCANTNGFVFSINPIAGAIDYTWTVPSGFNIMAGQTTTSITVDIGPSPVAGDVCVVANYACGVSQPKCKLVNITGTAVGFISGPANVCIGTTGIAYSVDTIPGATAYNWILPTGMTQASGGTTNSITVDVGVGFVISDICVSVTTPCGTGVPACRTIQVTNANQPGPITGPVVVCPGTPGLVYTIAPVVGAVTYHWTVPTGVSIVTGTHVPTLVVDIDSTFTLGDICVTSESACGTLSTPTCISVFDIADYTPDSIAGPDSVCLNSTGNEYSIPATNGADSYSWTLPAGMTFTAGSAIDSNVVFVDVDSTFTQDDICVELVASCGNSLSQCKTINVGGLTPPAMPGGITGARVVCVNTTGLVYSINPIVGITTYTWTVPTGISLVSGAGTTSITVDIGPSYTTGDICVTVTSPCGLESAPRCVTVDNILNSTPPNITGPGSVCLNATGLQFIVPVVNGADSYNWILPAGITFTAGTTTDSSTIFVDIGPAYTTGSICVETVNSCGSSLDRCKSVKEISLVLPGAITGPEIVCQNTTEDYSVQPVSGAVSYDWIVPPGITITNGLNTNAITVSIDNTFTTGDIGVRAVADCGDESLIRWNNRTTSTIADLPVSISASAGICPGTTVEFSTLAIEDAAGYEWVLPAGMTFAAGTPTDSNSVTVEIGMTFAQGSVCVKVLSDCGVAGNMKCQIFSIAPGTPGFITGPTGVCGTDTGIQYSIVAVSNAASYNWTLPDGFVITAGAGTNAITVNAAPGFFQGQLSVNGVSSCGQEGGKRYLNLSNNPATPDDIFGPSALCTGAISSFSVPEVNGADSYTWTLPTGVTVETGTPADESSISVEVDGSYTGGEVCVVANSDCGGTSQESCLTVGTTPEAPEAILGDAAVCDSATTVSYMILALPGITDYTWTVPANISIQSGQGTDSITVDIGPGFTSGQICVVANTPCSSSTSTCLDVSLTPGASVDIIPQVNFCPGTVRTLTVEEVSGASAYNWVLPAGMTEVYGQGTNTITVLVDAGFTSDQVCVSAATSCGATGAQYCETISSSSPNAPTSIIASAIPCVGSDVSFSTPEIDGAGSYNWTVPAGLTIVSGQGSASIVVNVGGGFTSGQVCATASSGCGVASTQTCQTFSTTPATPGNIVGPPAICPNSTGNIYNVPVLNGASSYNWVVPAGITITSGQGTNAIVVDADGSFTTGLLSVTAVSACGVAGSPRTLTIGSLLVTPGAIIPPASNCNNSTGVIFSVPLLTGATSYLWSVPADITITSGQGTNQITVDIGAVFTTGQLCVQGISACGTPGASRCRTVRTLPNMPGGITGQLNNVCNQTLTYSVSNASGATSYTWTPPANATIVSGQGTNSIDVEFSGSFTTGQLQVVSVNVCGSSAPRISGMITCGPAAAQAEPKVMAPVNTADWTINVYPVPATTELTTEFYAAQSTNYQIELFDLSGKVVLSNNFAATEGFNSQKSDVSSLPKGLYILKVSGADGSSDHSKIIIE